MAPPFFIVGSARSGTTLLRLILNAHPAIAVPPESRFVTELWQGVDEEDLPGFLHRLARHRQFQAWELPIEAVATEIGERESIAYADAISAVYRAFAKAHGKETWGDKTPRYVLQIDLIARLFPDARFVHLVRDGRNVALSYAGMPFGPKTAPKAAAVWSERVMAGVKQGRPLGPERYVEIRYEDLVRDTEVIVKELCSFLHVPFDPAMLNYTERARDFVFEKAARYNPHVLEKPRTDVRSWEDTMPPRQVELFEAVAGHALDEFGYPRRVAEPSLGAKVSARLGLLGLPIGRLVANAEPRSNA